MRLPPTTARTPFQDPQLPHTSLIDIPFRPRIPPRVFLRYRLSCPCPGTHHLCIPTCFRSVLGRLCCSYVCPSNVRLPDVGGDVSIVEGVGEQSNDNETIAVLMYCNKGARASTSELEVDVYVRTALHRGARSAGSLPQLRFEGKEKVHSGAKRMH
ncbi:hypothetical protein OH77DRAFT_1286236 [Trametes cingulata]|nr:hypothetical protein OH77DRAFT_1286236 [Trametes cingulata]